MPQEALLCEFIKCAGTWTALVKITYMTSYDENNKDI